MASQPSRRSIFINSTIEFLRKRNFDGLDIDWEYPATRGGPPQDKMNLASLMKVSLHIYGRYHCLVVFSLSLFLFKWFLIAPPLGFNVIIVGLSLLCSVLFTIFHVLHRLKMFLYLRDCDSYSGHLIFHDDFISFVFLIYLKCLKKLHTKFIKLLRRCFSIHVIFFKKVFGHNHDLVHQSQNMYVIN